MQTARLLLVAAVVAAAAGRASAVVDPPPEPPTLGERCRVPFMLDDPRSMEVHLRCILATLGNPIVLPNPFTEDEKAKEDEQALYDGYCKAVNEALEHLDNLKGRLGEGPKRPTGAAVGDLEELIRSSADSVRAFQQALEGLNGREEDPNRCRDLFTFGEERPDPDGGDLCDVLRNPNPDPNDHPDNPNFENGPGARGLTVNVGGHLVPFPRYGTPHAPKERIADGQVPQGGAFVVLKEFFGLRLKLYWRWVPIWQEPWTSRARIIGYRRRLYLRWVPCEYLKSIIYEDHGDDYVKDGEGLVGYRGIQPRVVTRDWCDHSLLGFWRFF